MVLVGDLSLEVREALCDLLDVDNGSTVKDARHLAELIGIGYAEINRLWKGRGGGGGQQPTAEVLDNLVTSKKTIDYLRQLLTKIGRFDCVEILNDPNLSKAYPNPIGAGSTCHNTTDGGGEMNRIVGTKEIIRTTSSQEGQAAVATIAKAPEKTDTTYYSVSSPIHELGEARLSENDEKREDFKVIHDEKVEKVQLNDVPDKCDEVSISTSISPNSNHDQNNVTDGGPSTSANGSANLKCKSKVQKISSANGSGTSTESSDPNPNEMTSTNEESGIPFAIPENIKSFREKLVEEYNATIKAYEAIVINNSEKEQRVNDALGTTTNIASLVIVIVSAITTGVTVATAGAAAPVVLLSAVVVKKVLKDMKQKKLEKVLNEAKQAGKETLRLIVEQSANELCRIFEHQLLMLDDAGEAKKLAIVVAKLMISHAETGDMIGVNVLLNRVLGNNGKNPEKIPLRVKENSYKWNTKGIIRKTGLRRYEEGHCNKSNSKIYKAVFREREGTKALKYGFRGEITLFGEQKQNKTDDDFNIERKEGGGNEKLKIPEDFFSYKPYHCLIFHYEDFKTFAENITSDPEFAAFVRRLYGYDNAQPVKPVLRPTEPFEKGPIVLRNATLENTDLSNAELKSFIFENCKFVWCTVLGANLESADLSNSTFNNTYFLNCCLDNVKACGSKWYQTTVRNCKVNGADFRNSKGVGNFLWDATDLSKALLD